MLFGMPLAFLCFFYMLNCIVTVFKEMLHTPESSVRHRLRKGSDLMGKSAVCLQNSVKYTFVHIFTEIFF